MSLLYRDVCGKKSSWKQTEIVQGKRNNNVLPRKWKTPPVVNPTPKKGMCSMFSLRHVYQNWLFDGRLLTVTNLKLSVEQPQLWGTFPHLLDYCCVFIPLIHSSQKWIWKLPQKINIWLQATLKTWCTLHIWHQILIDFLPFLKTTWSYPGQLGATFVFKLGHPTCFQLSSLDLRCPKRAESSWKFNISREDREWHQSWEHQQNSNSPFLKPHNCNMHYYIF